MKKILVLLLVAIMGLSVLAGCGGKDENTIIVGYDNKFAPMGYVDADNNDVGYDLDLARALGEITGKTIELKAIDWSSKETELNSYQIDVIWNGFTITDERRENVLFSNPYLKNDQVIVIRKDDIAKYVDDESVKGATIVAQKGSTAIGVINENDNLNGKLTELSDNVNVLTELQGEMHEIAVMDSVVANYLIEQNYDDLMVVDFVLASEEYGIGVRKGDTELVELINSSLKTLLDNGTMETIAKKYGLESLILTDEINKG